MPTTRVNIIKPSLGLNAMPDGDVLARLNAAHAGLLNNPAYPNPPVDLGSFKTAIETFTAASAAALHNGGKFAVEERNKRRAEAVVMYRLLGHYVEAASKNDMNVFVSSGFTASSNGQRTPPQPVSAPSIAWLDQGSSGQLLVTINPVVRALHYEIRYATAPVAGANVTWSTTLTTKTKSATSINNLTPGATYTFQVRAFGRLGYSDWSAAVQRMAI